MTLDATTHEKILSAIPELRAFAVLLTGNVGRADDLVQDTLLRGIAKINLLPADTPLIAWLLAILRNRFRSGYGERKSEINGPNGTYATSFLGDPDQTDHLRFVELTEALSKLTDDHREAIVLVEAANYSYPEAAEICGCPVGTIKSRVNRARLKLAAMLEIDEKNEIRPKEWNMAVLAFNDQYRSKL